MNVERVLFGITCPNVELGSPLWYAQRASFLRLKTPRYAGSSKKAKPLHKLKKGFLCEITSCLDSKSIHKGTQ